MLANLDRQNFIDLLNKLGDPNDDEVIAAARDLHRPGRCFGFDVG